MNRAIFCLLLVTVSAVWAQSGGAGAILPVQRLMVRQKYPEATAQAKAILSKDPHNIDAIYMLAAIEQMRIMDYESYTIDGRKFLVLADSLLKMLEARQPHLTGADSLRGLFYRANIVGGMGLVQAKRGAWFEGARTAMTSAGLYRQIKKIDPGHKGADFGLGVYDYYVGTTLRWVPFVASGNAERGLEALERAINAPFPFNHAAKNSLCWILIDRREFRRADSLAQAALQEAFGSTIFLRIRALANLLMKNYEEALRIGSELAAASEARSPVNWSDLMMGYYITASAYDNAGRQPEARATADKALAVPVPETYKSIPHVREHIRNLMGIRGR